MENKQAIKEEQGVHKQWYEEASKQTLETLPGFMTRLLEGYQHDYGTCCHAVAASAIAAAWAGNDVVGLTGFQAGAVMWGFIRAWNYSDNKCGLRILDYDNVLYPQYADTFSGQTISEDIWKLIQAEASSKIEEDEKKAADYLVAVAQWQADIAAFKEQFPDYNQRPEYYQRLSAGTGDQWEAERIKEESGFVFAPHEPYEGTAAPRVKAHWRSIAQGRLPFGMRIVRD